MQFDYVIVGGGSAGCVLANRLSANPANRVCLLEAGPDDDSLLVRMPAGIIGLMRSNKRNWRYYTVAQRHLNDRQLYIPRGKTLGGSSAVNAMIYTRGHPSDYDHWEALGNPGWGWRDVLPIFKRAENHEAGADEFHGSGGPLNVSKLTFSHGVTDAWVKAAIQAGYPDNDEFNNATQEGVGLYEVTQKAGERFGVARGYLHPIEDRDNLTVITEARVTRVLMDGTRVYGVEYLYQSHLHTIEAGEVLLSGGTINSPQVLKLSGIGPAAELKEHGIEVRHELPGVGENLQDHPDVLVVHKALTNESMNLSPAWLPHAVKAIWNWFLRRQGPFTSNAAEAGGFIKSRLEEPIPDLQLHLTAARLDNHGLNILFSMGYGFSGHVCLLRPKSRGRVTLQSADPYADALIDPNFLAEAEDMEGMVRGVKRMREIMAQSALDSQRGDELFPGAPVQTDEKIRGFIREKCDNIYHPVGTCKMGTDDRAVVDPQLRVHGLEGLRVIDASIMPTLIGGNTNAPTVMIAEKGADIILNE